MPTRFTCPHCGQLLSVSRRKIGQAVSCPKCTGTVLVPPPITPDQVLPHVVEQPSLPTPLTGDSSHDEYLEDNQLTSAARSQPLAATADSTVNLSRGVLYSFGGLLISVAILAFLLGLSMGRFSLGEGAARDLNSPCTVTGRLTYLTSTGADAADSEAVIVIVPVGREPDQSLSVAPLRPDAPPPDARHPTLRGIRSIGGDFARAQPNGEFTVEVPRAGEYFVLLLSSHARRQDRRPPTTTEIAQIARYVKPADMLLGANAFRWTKEFIGANTTIDHLFVGG